MNPVNQAQMTEFAESFALQSEKESDQFELYSIFSILNGASGENVDPFDAHLKGTEFGLDGVAIIVQGKLVTNADEASAAIGDSTNPSVDFYFFQGKTSAKFEYGDISKFFDAVSEFFSGVHSGESGQLDDLISAKSYIYANAVKRRNPGVSLYYATTGNYESNTRVDRLIENTRNGLSELNIFDSERIYINLVGAGQLQRLYRAAVTASEVQIEFGKNIVLPKHSGVQEGFLGYLAASELLKIVSVYDDDKEIASINKAVFFDNIRDYNPSSKINKEIAESLAAGEHDNFIYRNNGITVVAKSVRRVGDTFTIEDFQIVNGCQTSNVIFHNRDKIDGVHIPFRLIGTKDEDFIFSIISGTNKQNPVRDEQFWSLLPFMKNLEEFSRKVVDQKHIHLERRENQYRSEAIEKARVVQMQPFFKAATAMLMGLPHRAARNYRTEIKERADAFFAETQDVRPFYAAAYLHYRLEFLWRNQKIDSNTKIYRFYIMDAVARQILGSASFERLPPRDQIKFAEKLVDFASDEKKMAKVVATVGKGLDQKLAELGINEDARERLRDTIRSESFFVSVRSTYTPGASQM